jgi:hypothetical protein
MVIVGKVLTVIVTVDSVEGIETRVVCAWISNVHMLS